MVFDLGKNSKEKNISNFSFEKLTQPIPSTSDVVRDS